MMMNKYLTFFATGFFISCLFIVSFNWIVDPFWYYRVVEIRGFNQVKPQFSSFELHFKPLIFARKKYQAIILGSSLSEIGLDPLHPALTKNDSKSFNFGTIGASWRRSFCHFYFAIQKSPINKVIWGLENYHEFQNYDCSKEIVKMGQTDHIKNLLSFTALKQSFWTLLQQDPLKATHTREGLFYYTRRQSIVKERFDFELSMYHQCQPNLDVDRTIKKLKGLREVVRTAISHNISIKFISNPMHAYVYEKLNDCKDDMVYWNWLHQVAEVLEEETSQNPNSIELWDFTGYNRFMAQRILSDQDVWYWQDPRHYNTELGDLMMDRMFGIKNLDEEGSDKLGSQITTNNLHSHVERIRNERKRFIQENPWFLLEYKTLG